LMLCKALITNNCIVTRYEQDLHVAIKEVIISRVSSSLWKFINISAHAVRYLTIRKPIRSICEFLRLLDIL